MSVWDQTNPIRQRRIIEDFAVGVFLGFIGGLLAGLAAGLGPVAMPRDLIDIVSKLTPLAAFVAATAAAVIAYLKFKSDREAQRFANAVTFYRRYLELAFQHVDYAEPDTKTPDERTDPKHFKEYEWFLGILFRACEELLEHSGGEATKWHRTIMGQLQYHKKYLRESEWLNQRGGILSYSPELQRLIQLVKTEPDDDA
ncbi:MAG: hypothetical protein JO220_06110 [Hyphomicrobiales bacterium]|nr:hypothetical protein [Hyphomicrobiales bacterium]